MQLVSKMVRRPEINHAATGLKMRQLRNSRQISLRALAIEMGFTPPYISDLELGKRNWAKPLAVKYERALQAIKNRGFAKPPAA